MKNQYKNLTLTLMALCVAGIVSAQETAKAAASAPGVQEFNNVMQWVFLGAIGVLVLATGYVVMNTMRMYQDLLTAAIAKEQGREIAVAVQETQKESIFSKLWFQLTGTGAIALEKEEDILIAHPHDGIYELDNRLPPWWLNMFYATIVFAVAYVVYYHISDTGKLSGDLYKEEMRVAEIEKAQIAERLANKVNENTVVALKDKVALDGGGATFTGKCAACHGQKGEGGVGPNLTDDYWLHGGDIKSIFKTVKNGVPDKGMIAWSGQLTPSEIQNVASYIVTLRGTNPPNPKAPQGDKYVPTVEAKDSTAADKSVGAVIK